MTLSQELICRIYEEKKLKPDAPKKLIYFVGPDGCGKSYKIKTLENTYRGYYQYITDEGLMSYLLERPNIFIRSLFYLQALWDRIIRAIKNAEITHQNTIFVEGHPFLSVLHCESYYRLYKGQIISKNDILNIRTVYDDITYYVKSNSLLNDFQQTIYYINLPLEINQKFLQNKNSCDELTEDVKNELMSEREIIHRDIIKLSEQFNNSEVIEINTLMGLDIAHMYLLGASGGC